MNNESKEIILTGYKRPFWHSIVAAFMYTLVILFIWTGYFRITHSNLFQWYEYNNSVVFFPLSIFPLLLGGYFSVKQKIFINVETKKIRYNFDFVFFKWNFYESIEEVEYISIFYLSNNEVYAFNLWFKKNKVYSLCSFDDFESALEFGKLLAKKLNIDLLDATEKGNSKWVEIS